MDCVCMRICLQDGSELYDIADGLSKRFEDRVKAMKLDVGAAPRADKSIPYVPMRVF